LSGTRKDLNWDNGYTYRLTSASGTTPLTLTLSGNALTGSIAQSNTTTSGYLSSTDWNTFNNKEPGLTKGNLTATGPISLNASRQVIGGTAEISIADASTSVKGAVQLSNSYSGTSQTVATTEKALTDGLATKVDGSGITMGKIFLSASDTIVWTASRTYALYWDQSTGEISIKNSNPVYPCDYWWQSQKKDVMEGNANAVPEITDEAIITISNDNDGFEIHFGRAEDSTGWCSVWLQYKNGFLVGHHIKY